MSLPVTASQTQTEASAGTPGPPQTPSPFNAPVRCASGVPVALPQRLSPRDVDSRMVLATSGFLMLTFVVLHLGANLLAFAGSATFDAYSRSLRELGSPLVGAGVLLTLARVGLATALVAHLGAHAWITLHSLRGYLAGASPTMADGRGPSSVDLPVPPAYAAHLLWILFPSGVAILLFVALHLAQLTVGATVPGFDPADPYRNLITTLRSGPVALAYVGVAVAVGAHLLVGVWSGMNSLHLIRPRTEHLARALAPAIALGTALGLAAVPVAVLLGTLN